MAAPTLQLTPLEQKIVWDEWLGAEIRAAYFAELCHNYQALQRLCTWAILATSSGAAISALGNLPADWVWLRPTLPVLTAALSLWSLVSNYAKNGTECSDLHFRWNKLAIDLEALWGDMYAPAAFARLSELRQRVAEISKSGTAFPNRVRRMRYWQAHVEAKH